MLLENVKNKIIDYRPSSRAKRLVFLVIIIAVMSHFFGKGEVKVSYIYEAMPAVYCDLSKTECVQTANGIAFEFINISNTNSKSIDLTLKFTEQFSYAINLVSLQIALSDGKTYSAELALKKASSDTWKINLDLSQFNSDQFKSVTDKKLRFWFSNRRYLFELPVYFK